MAATASQFSCLCAINRGFRLQHRRPFLASRPSLSFPKFSIVMSVEGSGSNAADSQTKTTLSYATDVSESQVATNSYPDVEKSPDVGNLENEKLQEPGGVGAVPKRTAKIHDFCFGIPFGLKDLFIQEAAKEFAKCSVGHFCLTFLLGMASRAEK
ncbi:protein FATTY ACID EXPORT 1 [Cucumis melo var. makuwa]|uniref:Protein FATTY ACID EXPORT 1 n=1 Tax=Cucumis melo var. makuwa TaxID=1194695 RepID=A0A5A7VKC5_CUCMM|nr:protein FATTY ACID EXPORT 1 [Cucumis melo var. makuwa]TYK14908.1 protein FATTY ACID EXPORT 1 [Cucumis melo var. makuwa]